MSEVEKLRALLKEAREWVELNGKAGCPADQCEQCVATDEMLQRIDAALAEPVVAYRKHDAETCCCADCCLLRQAREERDEARAEVERLRGEAAAWREHSEAAERFRKSAVAEAEAEVAYWKGEFTRLHAEHLPIAFAGAYQRGAEAMREAAASCVGSDTALLQTYRSVLEGRIRDLPVPEDKP